ncbi:MAG: MFS transporter [Rhodospirillaceae bacterium]|nr:MFS transporter [Rhodospirillaceae bacterium]
MDTIQTQSQSTSSTARPWVAMAVLALLYMSSYIDRTILGILVGPIKKDLDITDTQFSLLTGFAFVIFYTVAGIPMGWMVDRFNRRNIIVWGVSVWSIMTAACGLVSSYWGLFAARIGVGVGEATLSPATYSITTDLFDAKRLARALSVYSLGIPIGTALASIIGGAVVNSVGAGEVISLPIVGDTKPWQLVFFIVGLPGLLLALMAHFLIKEPPRTKRPSDIAGHVSFGDTFSYLFRNRRAYAALFLGPALVNMFSFSVIAWYPAYLQRVHDMPIAQSGLFVGLSTMTFGIVGTVFSGWLADRFVTRGNLDGHMRVGMLYGLGIFICGGLGPLMPVVAVSLALAAFTMFFSNTWNGVSAAALQLVTPPQMRGQMSAIWLFFSNLVVMTFGPLMVALITDYIFGREDAVGYSLAMSATISAALGSLAMFSGLKHVAALAKARQAA